MLFLFAKSFSRPFFIGGKNLGQLVNYQSLTSNFKQVTSSKIICFVNGPKHDLQAFICGKVLEFLPRKLIEINWRETWACCKVFFQPRCEGIFAIFGRGRKASSQCFYISIPK